jgi:hypothetical protein
LAIFFLLNPLPRPICLVKSIVHLRSVLSRPALFDDFLDNAFECSDAVAALSVPCQSVMACKSIAAQTWIWLASSVDLRMSLEIMATNEAFVAVVASELPISEMSLDVRFDVLLAAESFIAFLVFADPFVVYLVWAFNELGNVVERDVCFLD